ncbi:MAG TPA: hypothetical protein VF973_00045 [Myxococcales bacterium]
MIAYKFLARGAVSPFSGEAWPPPSGATPGAWVAVSGPELWIHGCRPADLPYWVDVELWRVELSDPARPIRRAVQAERGRLLERIEAWGVASKRDFALECALRTARFAAEAFGQEGRESEARALSSCRTLDDLAAAAEAVGQEQLPARSRQLLGYCGDAVFWGRPSHAGCVSYIAAIAAADLRGDPAAVEDERAWQARWLCDRLGISPGA